MFVFSYFRTVSEALHLAISDDGLSWSPLDGNRPVFSATIGARSVRDPFLLQDENGLFHLLSTNSWLASNILHAVSDDLLHWRDETLIPVMQGVAGGRNAWAPEAFFDAQNGLYRLIWSSSTSEHGDASNDWDHRIWSASTRDWESFSAPQLLFDPGYSVIDAHIV